MKILFIISSLSSGGAERVLSNLANYLCKKHEVIIATFSNQESFYPLDNKVKLIKLDLLKESRNPFESIKNSFNRIKTLTNCMKEVQSDIVISFMTATNILAIISAKIVSVPIIISERTNFTALQSKIWRAIRRVVYPFSNALVVQSAFDQEKYGFHRFCKVISNPINIANVYSGIQRKKVILAVGSLRHVKGFDMLIDAFSEINSKDWKLVILGEGGLRNELQKQIMGFDLEDKITMPGNVKDVEKYYRESSIFVLSSRHEGFPNALIEAMAYGCAPIAFDCLTGPRDIIEDQKNGLLIEAENINYLAGAMQNLIDDKDLRADLSSEAVKVREKYNIKKIANEWEEIIHKVLTK